MDRKPEYPPSQPYLRPYVLGVAAIVAVMGAIVVIDQNRQDRHAADELSVPAGRMEVAGGGAPAASGAGSPAEAEPPRVGVYEMMQGKDEAAIDGPTEQVTVRTMPLPPPARPEAAPEPAEAVKGAKPEGLAQAITETLSAAETVPEPAAKEGMAESTPQAAPAQPPAPAPEPAATAPVPMASAPPVSASKSVDKAVTKTAEAAYTLQVASFSKKPMAEELANRLADGGFKSYLVEVDLGKKGTWWRVRVGHYPTEHAAKWARLDLVKEGLSPIVVNDRPAQP